MYRYTDVLSVHPLWLFLALFAFICMGTYFAHLIITDSNEVVFDNEIAFATELNDNWSNYSSNELQVEEIEVDLQYILLKPRMAHTSSSKRDHDEILQSV